jgi:hypothetical protein
MPRAEWTREDRVENDKCKFAAEEVIVQAAKLMLTALQLANFGLRPYRRYGSSLQLSYLLRQSRADILWWGLAGESIKSQKRGGWFVYDHQCLIFYIQTSVSLIHIIATKPNFELLRRSTTDSHNSNVIPMPHTTTPSNFTVTTQISLRRWLLGCTTVTC